MDDYDAHNTEQVRSTLKDLNCEPIQVPTSLTHLAQPLNVGVNGVLKRRAREMWVRDKATGKENADTLGRAAERTNDAYQELPASTITKAFEKAVPTLALPR